MVEPVTRLPGLFFGSSSDEDFKTLLLGIVGPYSFLSLFPSMHDVPPRFPFPILRGPVLYYLDPYINSHDGTPSIAVTGCAGLGRIFLLRMAR